MSDRATTLVYKIVPAADWRAAAADRVYTGSPDDVRDGFIHLSTAEQVAGTAARHFKSRADLLLVAYEVSALGGALRWEPSRGGALFPHLFGHLVPAAAIWARPMTLDQNGVPMASGDLA